jgi:hypothetical protein
MWQPLARARHRLAGRTPAAVSSRVDAGPPTDLTLALGRADLERLIGALAEVPGIDAARPDTPARLEAALGAAIAGVAGLGTPTVTRCPAGLYTPETWQIVVVGADNRTRTTLDKAIRGGGLA